MRGFLAQMPEFLLESFQIRIGKFLEINQIIASTCQRADEFVQF